MIKASDEPMDEEEISKWECGNTYPDITLLPEVAGFFNVSVDALLDYRIEPANAQDYRDQLRDFAKTSDHRTGLIVAEEALSKYPNDFEILLNTGHLTLQKGTAEETPEKATVLKSIDYFKKAISVIPQDSPTKKEGIEQNIAFAYGSIGEYEKAISILENNNINGCFNPEIARYMMKSGNMNAAKSRLQNHLWQTAFEFAMVTGGLMECFRAENNLQYVIDLQRIHANFHENFTHHTPNYSDLICSWSFLKLAQLQDEAGDQTGMWESIGKGVYHAIRFDQNPSYSMESVKFMNGSKGWLGNSSPQNACRGAINHLKADFPKYQIDARMIATIQELETSATDKVSTGVWKS